MAYVFALVAAGVGAGIAWLVSKGKKAAPSVTHANVGVVPGAPVVPGAHAPGVVPPAAAASGLGGLTSTLENMRNIAPTTPSEAGAPVPMAPVLSLIPAGPARNMAIQEAINLAGYTPPLVVDGNIGPKSVAGIKWWQANHPPLIVDGLAGPKTLASMGLASVS